MTLEERIRSKKSSGINRISHGYHLNQVIEIAEEYAKEQCIAFLKALQEEYDWGNLDIRDADPEELYKLFKDHEDDKDTTAGS